jgi:dipeptidyl aminopeptidase/acylaminoacyl peptidase
MKNIFKNNLLDEGYEKFEKQGYADLGFARKVHCTKDFLSDLEKNDVFNNYHSNHKVLLVHGTDDECAPYEDAVRFEEKHENITLKTIVGAGHRFLNPGEIEKAIEIASNYYIRK